MIRLAFVLLLLFALFAVPAGAEDTAGAATPEVPEVSELTTDVDAAAADRCASKDAQVALLASFEDTLSRLEAQAETAFSCGGPGCINSLQCYISDRCGYTGGACFQGCCFCY